MQIPSKHLFLLEGQSNKLLSFLFLLILFYGQHLSKLELNCLHMLTPLDQPVAHIPFCLSLPDTFPQKGNSYAKKVSVSWESGGDKKGCPAFEHLFFFRQEWSIREWLGKSVVNFISVGGEEFKENLKISISCSEIIKFTKVGIKISECNLMINIWTISSKAATFDSEGWSQCIKKILFFLPLILCVRAHQRFI